MTRARIVALALIGLVVLGLAYVRFAGGEDSVSVPKGAHAGDLKLKPCSYTTERGSYAADCGTLVVPENRADPQSRLIALPVKRIRARTAHPGEPVFQLEGGPGKTNMDFEDASRFAGARDVVLVGYRGVDGSVKLDCPEVESALAHSTDVLSEKSFRAYAGGFRSCARRLQADGIDVTAYGPVQQVDDLEAARRALGYGRIDLLSESAGTRTALIYAWRYPRSIHRSVMVGVNPPGHFMWDPATTDVEIARYAALCAKDASCSKRTSNLAATIRSTNADLPGHWLFLRIKRSNVRAASFFGLMESTSKATPFSGPSILDAWLSGAKGDKSGFWFSSVAGDLLFPKMFTWGQYAAFGSVDSPAARAYFSSGGRDFGSNLGRAATAFVWGGGRLPDAWPTAAEADQYSRVQPSNVETLLIGGDLDFSTPPQIATRELLPYLHNGHQVVLAGFGHSGSFFNYQPDAGTHLINTFLDSGRVDDSLYRPGVIDFTPEPTFTSLAKLALGVMAGLALIALVALLWMARRVHARGGFGRTASAALRSLLPIVLGLGGWFAGALFVLTALPGVPLDDELLAVLAVGVPIWLGIHLAWVHRDRPAQVKAAGFAAAAAGAFGGAWLGFDATDGLPALLTAIAGAIAGANLLLLAFDITRDRPAGPGEPPPEPRAEPVESRPPAAVA